MKTSIPFSSKKFIFLMKL